MTDHGFMLPLDMTVYARPAVMKAFYRFQNRYIISYERKNSVLNVYFDYPSEQSSSAFTDIKEVMAELSFEMIRYDTVCNTSNLRELLVGRALYATCIEIGRENSTTQDNASESSWIEDSDHIFASWTGER